MLNRRDFFRTVGSATAGMCVMSRCGDIVAFAALQDS